MTKRVLYIDGDMVAYTICAACEEATDWGDEVWTLHADEREAKQRCDVWIADLKDTLSGASVVLAFTDYTQPNWRLSVLPTYKSNRKGGRKPVVYWPVRRYLFETYRCLNQPGLEADDLLGIQMTTREKDQEKVLVGEDKDFKSIPGLLFNPNREDEGLVQTSLEDADRYHLYQTLVGDKVDGYGGCPGVGPVTAERVLKAHQDDPWAAVVHLYEKAGLGEEDALAQARVARILRKGEYDKKTQRVKLWSPH